ncbi:MAG: hypothetical protein K5843_06130 [Bacteroidales bacterium]|nr:hypothetical protein [Bacteroidales bacterium]
MKKVLYILLLSLLAVSCKMTRQFQDAASELFRGQVVARVGNHKLYRSELLKYIPAGASPEDSASLALQWINAWAEDILLLDMAEEQLSGEDKDVRKELEEYRRTLLKYRYEQLYINQRLDTLITDEEIEQYYLANKERFRLERPLMKARYMIISAGARSLPVLKEKMSSDNEQEIMMADSLGSYAAIKYVDAADTWMDAITLASEMGIDYLSLVASIKNRFSELKDENGNLHIAYIAEMAPEGHTAPLDYVADRIRDIILSARKHKLEIELERDLLEDASRNQKFVIY